MINAVIWCPFLNNWVPLWKTEFVTCLVVLGKKMCWRLVDSNILILGDFQDSARQGYNFADLLLADLLFWVERWAKDPRSPCQPSLPWQQCGVEYPLWHRWWILKVLKWGRTRVVEQETVSGLNSRKIPIWMGSCRLLEAGRWHRRGLAMHFLQFSLLMPITAGLFWRE